MVDLGVAIPARHQLVSLVDRPDLRRPMSAFTTPQWAEFLNQDEIANRLWHHLNEAFAAFQLCLLDHAGAFVAAQNAAPIAWDGTDQDLPNGWDDQFERSVAGLLAGTAPTSLGALQIVVDPDRRGEGLAGLMVEAMRSNAAAHGLRSVIACVRPTLKEAYPITPIERYVRWTRSDGLPFDPWVRIHARLGGRVVRTEPRSMSIRGSLAEWEAWTGMTFPESGDYVIPRATSVLHVDREAGVGVHHDENVWMVHDVA